MGRVLGDSGRTGATPGDTLVTSLDAKLQGVVEQQLHEAIDDRAQDLRQGHPQELRRRQRCDRRPGREGRQRRRDGRPADVRPLGVGRRHHHQAAQGPHSKKAGNPLLARATQGQFAPGSTWKPIMTVGALNHGFSQSTRLDCSSGVQVGNRWFKNYESAAYGMIDFARALELSCDTFFYRVGLSFWNRTAPTPPTSTPRTRWSSRPRRSASGRRPGSTSRARRAAGSPTGSGSSTTGTR